MSRTLAHRGLSALLALACVAAALLVLHEEPAPSRAPAFALAADGALTLQSDRHGVAILQAAGMRPGDVTQGTVTLSVSAAAVLTLRAEAGAEQPGAGGGRLSERLVLAIDDVTDPAQPAAVFSGTLAQAVAVGLGRLPAGADRRYRFRVTFPPGTGDNALQGAALTARFAWTAVAAATKVSPTPAPTVTPAPPTLPPATGTPDGTPPPATAPAAARVSGLPAGRCVKRRRYKLSAKPLAGVRVKSVAVYVGGRARGSRKPRKAALNLKRVKGAKVAVRIVVKTTAGKVTVARKYRLCRR